MNNRNAELDSLKGVLILLVVLGHFVKQGYDNTINMCTYNFIYLFHMPLFVFISGYLTHIDSNKGGKFWKGILSLTGVYAVYQIFDSICIGNQDLSSILFYPAPTLWYLLALIVWRVSYYFLNKIGASNKLFLVVIFVALGLIAGCFSRIGLFFSLSRIFVFSPFFFLGILLNEVDFISKCKKFPYTLGIVGLIGVFACLLLLNKDFAFVIRGTQGYAADALLKGVASRAGFYVIALIMSVMLISTIKENRILSIVGRDTLKFYLFHGVIRMFMLMLPIPWTFHWSIAYWIVVSVIIYYFNTTKLSDILVNPIGYLINKK